jgi:hypothetical protein
MYLVNNPVAGLRVGAFSCGNVLSIKTSLKQRLHFQSFHHQVMYGPKFSSGCEAVPKPS